MELPISGRAGRMGRPPLNVKPTQVRLDVADQERIDELRGPGRRAEFIREAVKEKLKREEKRAKG
jgi:Arc/MetJ-type ribon-helix-helix transcriptional regulator